ncbi:hypothetical protein HK097_002729 [Rhizophlyctis rosea]|uniref:Tubulin polymerization promoting protein n=1 Tax=Rhizophlyctis rosea TaxID=64517 RepID=A0AAD5X002_9FUNG|nr:hypothetical protein HK097_002729 [Rhizophlyctis rosea]
MGDLEDLQRMYEAFCSFGSSKNLAGGTPASGSMTDLTGPQMDGAKFAKFMRDNKLINKNLTTTDVDIIFNKVKPKGARKIDWSTFLEGLRLVGEKRAGGKKGNEAFDAVVTLLLRAGKGPVSSGTVPQSDAVVDRMTDTTLYTGTHKLRFDAEGHGRGIEGRDAPSKTNDLATITNRNEPASVRGIPASADPAEKGKGKRGHGNVVTASSEKLDLISNKPKKTGQTSTRASAADLSKSTSPAKKPTTASKSYNATTPQTGTGSSVFNRLTDSSGYTGTHKQRFNADGSGKGLAGRDSPAKGAAPGQYRGGDVKDLSQILRS